MKTIKKTIASTIAAGITSAALIGTAAADNAIYGDTRINQLPVKSVAANPIWVGSWWAYSRDGIAYRHKSARDFPECSGVNAELPPQQLIDNGKAFCLSAAEKVDFLKGKIGDIEWDKIAEYQRIAQEDLGPLQERTRELVRVLNKWIADNPGEDWRETDDGKEYLEKKEQLDTAKEALPEINIDTATEFERINHGRGVPGVGGWWGHCNAWAAAAIMEPEPKERGAVEHNGVSVEFTPGEAKALITELWMEHHSSFHGSRHNDPENEGLKYDDLTASAFHIYFGTQLGQKKKSFVIDRYTGDQVWNQPVRSYIARGEALYENDTAETIELFQTTYDRRTGEPSRKSIGEQAVYPVQYTTTIHWITDGLPHEVETLDNIAAPEYPTTHSAMHALWGNQVEMRTLTYTLYLDKPLSDANARIVGDGEWDEAMAGSNTAHPDFVWQPLAQTPPRRDYENPFVHEGNLVHDLVVPATAKKGSAQASSVERSSEDTPIDIPDNDPTGISSTIDFAAPGPIVSMEIAVDVTHTWRGDLRVVLKKDGTSVVLADKEGGGADDIKRSFDVPDFNGQIADGTYTLSIVDTAGQDVGTLNSWTIIATIDGSVDPIDPPPAGGEGDWTAADVPANIPDNDDTGVSRTITIDQDGKIESLSVDVDITHTWRGDLLVVLERMGETVVLHNRKGRSQNDLKQIFEIDAFTGKDLRGEWTLKVSDHAGQDVGTLNGFTLTAKWN